MIHDDLEKTVLGNPIPAGGGQADGEQVLDILASHPSTATFIATKLCRRFISDTPAQTSGDRSGGQRLSPVQTAISRIPCVRCLRRRRFSRVPIEVYPPERIPGGVGARAGARYRLSARHGQSWFYAQNTRADYRFTGRPRMAIRTIESYWASTGGLLNRWRLSFLSFAGIIPGDPRYRLPANAEWCRYAGDGGRCDYRGGADATAVRRRSRHYLAVAQGLVRSNRKRDTGGYCAGAGIGAGGGGADQFGLFSLALGENGVDNQPNCCPSDASRSRYPGMHFPARRGRRS